MTCIECEILKNRKNLIYEDELAFAFLTTKPSTAGHIIVATKQHFAIIEMIPDEIMEHLFLVANKISTTCFDIFKAHGTNILIKNGVAGGQQTTHANIQILPRFENDGLNLQWNTLKLSDDDMSTSELSLKAEMEREESEQYKAKEMAKLDNRKQEKFPENEDIPEEENYMLRQLDRIP